MDLNRTATRVASAVAVVFTLAPLGPSRASAGIDVIGASPPERHVVSWVESRYDTASMELPALTVGFHASATACRGNSGLFLGDRLDVCTRGNALEYQRNVVMHELAHAWLDVHLSDATRRAFLAARGLSSWNDPGDAWGLRGFEQAAEVITWGIGDREIPPLIPGHPSDNDLAAAFAILTGHAPMPS
jgi:hypothetical protein